MLRCVFRLTMASRCANSTSMSRKSLRGGGQPPGPGLAAGGEADASYEKQQLSAAAQRLRAVRQSGGWKGMRWADDFPSQSAPGIENQGAGIEAALHGTARSHKIGSDAQPSATPVGASRGSRGSGNPDASSGHAASSPIGDDLPRPGVHTQGGFRSDRDRPSGAERRAGEGRGQGGDGDGRRAPSHPVGGVSDAVLRRQAEQAAEAEENRTAWGPRPRGWLARVDRATLVHPNRSFRVGWDVALLALLCYIALVVPFRIAFLSLSDAPWMEPLSHAITALFMVDVLLNFRTGYVHAESGVVVLDSARIARLYLRSWFAVDLVASVPWEWIFDRANVDSDGVSPQLLKALRLLRLSRLTKLLRLLKVRAGAGCTAAAPPWWGGNAPDHPLPRSHTNAHRFNTSLTSWKSGWKSTATTCTLSGWCSWSQFLPTFLRAASSSRPPSTPTPSLARGSRMTLSVGLMPGSWTNTWPHSTGARPLWQRCCSRATHPNPPLAGASP